MAVISKTRVQALLQHPKRGNLEIDARDEEGRTPLHYAAVAGNSAVMELLIDDGADVHATDDLGITTAHFAVLHQHCITTAAKRGSNLNTEHIDLGTPLQFANSFNEDGQYEHEVRIIKELLKSGGLPIDGAQELKKRWHEFSQVHEAIYDWMLGLLNAYTVIH